MFLIFWVDTFKCACLIWIFLHCILLSRKAFPLKAVILLALVNPSPKACLLASRLVLSFDNLCWSFWTLVLFSSKFLNKASKYAFDPSIRVSINSNDPLSNFPIPLRILITLPLTCAFPAWLGSASVSKRDEIIGFNPSWVSLVLANSTLNSDKLLKNSSFSSIKAFFPWATGFFGEFFLHGMLHELLHGHV